MPPPPRSSTRLPPALTPSAVAARSAFFCELCQKGYARMNEFEAHEMSYDHQHKKRLKEMKGLQRSMEGTGREDREKGPLISVKLGSSGAGATVGGRKDGKSGTTVGGGFKKGGFKNAFAPVGGVGQDESSGGREENAASERVEVNMEEGPAVDQGIDSDVTDEEDYYDPSRPTGCQPNCPGSAPR